LSYDKTCFIVFGTKKVRDTDVSIKINSYEVAKVRHCKYLGVIIDDELNWTKHIDNMYNKIVRFSGIIYKFSGIIYKMRDKVPLQCLKDVYFSFVYPHIMYGIE